MKAEGAILLRLQLQETSSHTLAIMEATSRQDLPQLARASRPEELPPSAPASAGGAGAGQVDGGMEGRAVEAQGAVAGREGGESSAGGTIGDRAVHRGLSFPDMPWDADLSEMDKVRPLSSGTAPMCRSLQSARSMPPTSNLPKTPPPPPPGLPTTNPKASPLICHL